MDLFATDRDRLAFLLETDAALDLDFEARAGELVTEELPQALRPKYITNYIGSKQKLVDWIWKHTPEDVGSVIDAFSGSAVVSYMYKTKGLLVLANDRLRYCYHAARAIIENRNVRLTDDDLEMLLADNPKAGTFVRDNFNGIFFAKGVHGLISTPSAPISTSSKDTRKTSPSSPWARPACPARAVSDTSPRPPATVSEERLGGKVGVKRLGSNLHY